MDLLREPAGRRDGDPAGNQAAAAGAAAGRAALLGSILLSGGIALFLWGLAEIGRRGSLTAALPVATLLVGVALVAGFVVHALRTAKPLIDIRLFTRRSFGSAWATNLLLGVALFGVALLLPLYFQIVRDRTPLETRLLLIPQALGAACAISLAGAMTDRVGARRVVPVGILLALAGTLGYTQIGVDSSYWYLACALFLVGAGLGATITPSMAAAFQDLEHAEMPGATSAINVVQRVAGSLGTALLAVVLQRAIAARVSGFHGGIGQAAALARHDPQHAAPAIADAFEPPSGLRSRGSCRARAGPLATREIEGVAMSRGAEPACPPPVGGVAASGGIALREALQQAGGIFIKFGQLLPARSALVPAAIALELSSLQDDVTPLPAPVVAAPVVLDVVDRELGISHQGAVRRVRAGTAGGGLDRGGASSAVAER